MAEVSNNEVNKLVNAKTIFIFKWLLIVWILVANGIIAATGFKYGWLIFISNIMMFTMGEGTPMFKFISVEVGGFVGLCFAIVLAIIDSKLIALGVNHVLALLIPLAVILFFLIICNGKLPYLFNNTGFAYLTVVTTAGNLPFFIKEMPTHFIGFIAGSLVFNFVSLLLLKLANNIAVKKYSYSVL